MTTSKDDQGTRIDVFISRGIGGLTRSAASALLEEGGSVKVDGKSVKKNFRLSEGQTVEVAIPKAREVDITPQDIPLDIVYEDDDVLVVNKRQGMVVHPAAGNPDGTLVNAVLHHCGDSLSGINGQVRPGIVHRIDKDTSGLIIVAKNDAAHLNLSKQLKTRTLSRIYEAVLLGVVKEDEGEITAPIGRSTKDRKKMAVTEKNSREATTYFKVVSRYPGYTHMRFKLKTGRTHQIRVHAAYMGHPVVGDATYGAKKNEFGLAGQCLHAREISFIHPRTGEEMHFVTDLPDYFKKTLLALEKRI